MRTLWDWVQILACWLLLLVFGFGFRLSMLAKVDDADGTAKILEGSVHTEYTPLAVSRRTTYHLIADINQGYCYTRSAPILSTDMF